MARSVNHDLAIVTNCYTFGVLPRVIEKLQLSNEEKSFLVDLIAKGKTSARKLKRANILLMSNNRMSQDKE
ncbi:hypothetical protein D5R81_20210, partial [Parashewanella spongiae]